MQNHSSSRTPKTLGLSAFFISTLQLFGQLWKYPAKQTSWKIGLLVRRQYSKFFLPWWHWSLWNLNKRLDKECSEDGEDNAGDELEEDPVEPDVDVVQRLICHLVRMKSQESGKLLQVVRKSAPKSQTIKLKLLQREKIGGGKFVIISTVIGTTFSFTTNRKQIARALCWDYLSLPWNNQSKLSSAIFCPLW